MSRYRTAEHQEAKDRKILSWDEQATARFWGKYAAPDENGCETWLGAPDHKGYGEFWANGQHFKAHRAAVILRLGLADYAYQAATLHDVGLKQSGLCAGKLCGVHVRLGSQAENTQAPDHAKLDWPQVEEIRASYAAGGVTQQELGKEYGVSGRQVSRIVNDKSWRARSR